MFFITLALFLSIWLGKKLLTSQSALGKKVVLTSSLDTQQGYVYRHDVNNDLAGKEAKVIAVLKPSGKVEIEGVIYEAISINGKYIDKGSIVIVAYAEKGILYCR